MAFRILPSLPKIDTYLTAYKLFLVQEHILYFITRLLSPPVPVDYSGSESHLIACAPMLNILLVGISPVDCVQIFSIHGLVCNVSQDHISKSNILLLGRREFSLETLRTSVKRTVLSFDRFRSLLVH